MTTSAPEPHRPLHHGRWGRAFPLLYVIGGAAVLAAYYLVPSGLEGTEAVWKVSLYCLLSVSAVAAIFIGIRRNRPPRPFAWYLVLLNQAIYATGDVTFYIRNDLLKITQYPSMSDVFYLLHYPILIVAVVIFIRRRSPGGDRSALIDAGVLAVTAAMLSSIFVIAPSINAPGQDTLARATSAAYPIMDVIMLAMAMWLLVGEGRRTRSFWLIGTALVLLFATDTIYALQQTAGTYRPGGFLDGMWVAYYLLIGATALDGSMVHLGEPLPAESRVPTASRFIGLGFAAVAVPAVLLIEQGRDTLDVFPVIAAGTAVLFILVILRLTGMVSEQRRIALADSLTGLPNRRYFETHYEIDCARARRSGQPLSMVLFDIDFFKSVNDGYGHSVGDIVLSEMAERLRLGVRAGDVLARYGGEEFAVLLAGAGVEEVQHIASRLSRAVSSNPFAVSEDLQIQLTVSAGIVTFPDHVGNPEDLASRGRPCPVCRQERRAQPARRRELRSAAQPVQARSSGPGDQLHRNPRRSCRRLPGTSGAREHDRTLGRSHRGRTRPGRIRPETLLHGRPPARRRQDRRADAHSDKDREADTRRVAIHPRPPEPRGASGLGRSGHEGGCRDSRAAPRAGRRHRIPQRSSRRRDPRRGADLECLRFVRLDAGGPALSTRTQ